MHSLQRTLEDKDSLLVALEAKLQDMQDKALRVDKVAAESLASAQQRHSAVEERARLAEQVLMHSMQL